LNEEGGGDENQSLRRKGRKGEKVRRKEGGKKGGIDELRGKRKQRKT
jgi:hypothetical protein